MPKLDTAAIEALDSASRPRKLSINERLAIFAFHKQGVPTKVIAEAFGVNPNAVRYITLWAHTAAHDNVSRRYDRLGAATVWKAIVTPEQTAAINRALTQATGAP